MSTKTLIISTYAPPALGGPQYLYNLLRDAPSETYSFLTSFYNIDNTSAQKGGWLAGEYIFYDRINKTKDSFFEREKETKSRSFISNLKHLMKRSSFFSILFGFPIIVGQILMITKIGLQVVKKENIRNIVSVSDYGPAIISSLFIAQKSNLPLIFLCFDIYKGNSFPFPGELLASFFEPKLIKKSERIIVNNNRAKDFYIKRYGKDVEKKIEVIYNSTFPDSYLQLHSPYNPRPPYTILYTGNISWPQIGSLNNLIRAIETISLPIQFKIYSPSPIDYLKKIGIRETEKVKIFRPVSPSEISKLQAEADILFLPLSWNTKSPEIINTATPGKMTDYLISGRPILVHAPPSSFLVKYAKENRFAHIIEREEIEELKIGISKLVTDIDYSKKLIENSKATFFRNHDINKNSKKFREIIGME